MTTGESTLRPVFLDVGGVRSRRVRLAGRAVALVLIAYLLASMAAVLGVAWVPRVSLPGLGPVVPGVGPALPPALGPAAVPTQPARGPVVAQPTAPAAPPAPPRPAVGGAASTAGATPLVDAPAP
ncbi:MAG: hypothetical protein M3396_05025, partial [Actinomycetota bacterium]|nr:hypothetical protein [Actinomycetota bacterium]